MLCSFIIPAYNASNTIVRCLDSIYALALNITDFEVIVIDDNSKDNTIDVVNEYVRQHRNITLLCQTVNRRQGAARNRGVNIAKGKYIVFVDSDDESDNGVVHALQLAEQYHLDMVAMHYVSIDKDDNITPKESIAIDGIFTGIELQTTFPYWCTGPVSYVYNAKFLQGVKYPFRSDVLFEDSDFVSVHLYHAKRMMYSAQCAYRIHYNANSTTHTITYKHIADYILLGKRMLDFYQSLNDTTSRYAMSILEGGSYNVWMSCKKLIKLHSIQDVHDFYNRLDSFIDYKTLLSYSKPVYCWTWWTKLCLKHKYLAIILIFIGQMAYKFKRLIKSKKRKLLQDESFQFLHH